MWVTFVSFVDHFEATYVFMQKVMVKCVNYVKMSSENIGAYLKKMAIKTTQNQYIRC